MLFNIMIRIIRGLCQIAILAVIGAGILAGPEIASIFGLGDMHDWAKYLLGGLVGAVAAAIVFGMLIVIIEMHDHLEAIRASLAKIENKPTGR